MDNYWDDDNNFVNDDYDRYDDDMEQYELNALREDARIDARNNHLANINSDCKLEIMRFQHLMELPEYSGLAKIYLEGLREFISDILGEE